MSEHTIQAPIWMWQACLLTICAVALWQGRSSERIGAATLFLGWAASIGLSQRNWWNASYTVVTVDFIILGVLVWLALRSRRHWPMWAAGFHLLSIVTHWVRVIDPKLGLWAYATSSLIWSYFTLFALGVGAFGAWRERQLEAKAAAADAIEPVEPNPARR